MAWSCVATMYHDGIVFHAGSPDRDVNASLENGRCAACIWLVVSIDPSPPQLLVLVEQAARDEQRVEVGADDPAAADALLRD